MERLCGPDSLQVVCRRFSDGVDVVKCVSGFIKEVGDAELSYSSSLEKLVRSHLYNFHSNFLKQLLGSTPYTEIGTVKHTWSELGNQLTSLAKLHAGKAQQYLEDVRRPLLDLAPRLEETRKEIRNRARQLRTDLETAAAKHVKEKLRYEQIVASVHKSTQKLFMAKDQSLTSPKEYLKREERLTMLKVELTLQETAYREAHKQHVEAKENFDANVKELYKSIHVMETERVNTIKKCLQAFARTLSNTVPAYLESMQHIVVSVQDINSESDIAAFVELQVARLGGQHEMEVGVPELQLPSIGNGITTHQNETFISSAILTATSESESEEEELRSKSSSGLCVSKLGEERVGVESERDSSPAPPPPPPAMPEREPHACKPNQLDNKPPLPCRPPVAAPTFATSTNVSPTHPRSTVPSSFSRPRSTVPTSFSHPCNTVSSSSLSATNQLLKKLACSAANPVSKHGINRTISQGGKKVAAATLKQSSPHTSPIMLARNRRPLPNGHIPVFSGVRPPSSSARHSGRLPSHPSSNASFPRSEGACSQLQRQQRLQQQQQSSPQHHQRLQQPSSPQDQQSSPQHQQRLQRPSSPQHQQSSPQNQQRLQKPLIPQHQKLSTSRLQKSASQLQQQHLGQAKESRMVIVEEAKLLDMLQQRAETNDYYKLLGVESDASDDELAKARRDKSRDLHPDHFTNNGMLKQKPSRKFLEALLLRKAGQTPMLTVNPFALENGITPGWISLLAVEKLVLINQVYQDVLKNSGSRENYNILCEFRKKYAHILEQKLKGLTTAQVKLAMLRKTLKKAQTPLPLLEEIDLALQLINSRLTHLKWQSRTQEPLCD